MVKIKKIRVFLGTGLGVCILASALIAQVPGKPSELRYPDLKFQPPHPKEFRYVLSNGIVLYIKEDHTLPMFDAFAIVRTGTINDPQDTIGLAAMTGSVMRTGGTRSISGDDLDERLAFLGATITSSIGVLSGTSNLSVLIRDVDEGLKLWADMLRAPAFQEDKIRLYKDQAIEALKNKNDSPRPVLEREFRKLLYAGHPLVWEETKASIEKISRNDLVRFHQRYYVPNHVILAVAGDFKTAQIIPKIEKAFAGWTRKSSSFSRIPEVREVNRPGVFMIQKKINQGYINIGHFGIKDTNPDYFAVQVMNFILGGGSFTSRITSKVRSDEGLAYNTGSRFDFGHMFPGTFAGYVQTKSATVPYAISLILEEFKKIRTEPVSDAEMETAKNFYLDSFPERFSTSIGTVTTFANLEYDKFPMDYLASYSAKIRAVAQDDVLRVAKKYIHPDQMSIMVVGDIESCKAGMDKYPITLDKMGPITVIPLVDPLAGP